MATADYGTRRWHLKYTFEGDTNPLLWTDEVKDAIRAEINGWASLRARDGTPLFTAEEVTFPSQMDAQVVFYPDTSSQLVLNQLPVTACEGGHNSYPDGTAVVHVPIDGVVDNYYLPVLQPLIAHEFGHALSLQHTGTWTASSMSGSAYPIMSTCYNSEYSGDPYMSPYLMHAQTADDLAALEQNLASPEPTSPLLNANGGFENFFAFWKVGYNSIEVVDASAQPSMVDHGQKALRLNSPSENDFIITPPVYAEWNNANDVPSRVGFKARMRSVETEWPNLNKTTFTLMHQPIAFPVGGPSDPEEYCTAQNAFITHNNVNFPVLGEVFQSSWVSYTGDGIWYPEDRHNVDEFTGTASHQGINAQIAISNVDGQGVMLDDVTVMMGEPTVGGG